MYIITSSNDWPKYYRLTFGPVLTYCSDADFAYFEKIILFPRVVHVGES